MTFTAGIPFTSAEIPPEKVLEFATNMKPVVPATVVRSLRTLYFACSIMPTRYAMTQEGHGGGPLSSQPGTKWEYGVCFRRDSS